MGVRVAHDSLDHNLDKGEGGIRTIVADGHRGGPDQRLIESISGYLQDDARESKQNFARTGQRNDRNEALALLRADRGKRAGRTGTRRCLEQRRSVSFMEEWGQLLRAQKRRERVQLGARKLAI